MINGKMGALVILAFLCPISVSTVGVFGEAKAASGAVALQVHPWWGLSWEQARVEVEWGRTAYRQGAKHLDLFYQNVCDAEIDDDVRLVAAALEAPPFVMREHGWTSEHQMDDEQTILAAAQRFLATYSQHVAFLVYLTSKDHLDRLREIKFVMETSDGERVKPVPLLTPSLDVDKSELSSWFTASHGPMFPLRDEAGKPYLTSETKWLRLWVITSARRTSVTWSLDSSLDATRCLRFGLPALSVRLEAPSALSVANNRYVPSPFAVTALVGNTGIVTGAVTTTLMLPPGLRFSASEAEPPDSDSSARRALVQPGEEVAFSWEVMAVGLPIGALLTLTANADAPRAKSCTAMAAIDVPAVDPEVHFLPEAQTVPLTVDGRSAIIPVEVRLSPAREFYGARFAITYDPKVIEPLFTSRGEAFMDQGRLLSPWRSGVIDRGAGVIAQIEGLRSDAPPLTVLNASLITVTFRAVAPGTSPLVLKEVEVLAPDGQQMEFEQFDGAVTVAPAP
jgi:hypothetical protein